MRIIFNEHILLSVRKKWNDLLFFHRIYMGKVEISSPFSLERKEFLSLKNWSFCRTPRNINNLSFIHIPKYFRSFKIFGEIGIPLFISFFDLLFPGGRIFCCMSIFKMFVRIDLIEVPFCPRNQSWTYSITSQLVAQIFFLSCLL